jgi:leader peptidase (prepilin peptidase) / N-methyltransferase
VTELAEETYERQSGPIPFLGHPGVTAFAAVILAFVAVARHGFGGRGLLDAAICAVLVVLAAVDLERRVIPNMIVVPAAAIVFLAEIALKPSHWLWYLGAALGAGLFFLVLAVLFRDGVGMGDVKLAALIGAALGSHVLSGLVLGSLAGAVAAVFLLATKGAAARKMTIAFGPYLAAGAIVVLLFS